MGVRLGALADRRPLGRLQPLLQALLRSAGGEAPKDGRIAIDHVGAVFKNGLDKPRILGRIVFEIGVLHDDDIAAGMLEADPKGRALALVMRLVEDNMALPFEVLQAISTRIAPERSARRRSAATSARAFVRVT